MREANWDHLKLDNFTSLQDVDCPGRRRRKIDGSSSTPKSTSNSGLLNGSPTPVVANSNGFITPPLATLKSRQPLSNITNIGGVLNGTPSAGGAECDGFETPPLPTYSSRQPLSNITNLYGNRTRNSVTNAATRSTTTSKNTPQTVATNSTVPCSNIFKNLFAATNSPQSCTTQNVVSRTVDTTQVPRSRLFHETNDDTNYEGLENSQSTDIHSEDEEQLSDDDGFDVFEDAEEAEPFEEAPAVHEGSLIFLHRNVP
ncbi:hypothetical protein ACET3Z_021250 [Daucus carota]